LGRERSSQATLPIKGARPANSLSPVVASLDTKDTESSGLPRETGSAVAPALRARSRSAADTGGRSFARATSRVRRGDTIGAGGAGGVVGTTDTGSTLPPGAPVHFPKSA